MGNIIQERFYYVGASRAVDKDRLVEELESYKETSAKEGVCLVPLLMSVVVFPLVLFLFLVPVSSVVYKQFVKRDSLETGP